MIDQPVVESNEALPIDIRSSDLVDLLRKNRMLHDGHEFFAHWIEKGRRCLGWVKVEYGSSQRKLGTEHHIPKPEMYYRNIFLNINGEKIFLTSQDLSYFDMEDLRSGHK